MITDSDKLAACPFCGGEGRSSPETVGWATGPVWCVICPICGGKSGFEDTEAEAITAWNTRSTPTEQDGLAREPVGYACLEHIQRRGEYERSGSVIYDRPLGTYTTPLYAHPASTNIQVAEAVAWLRELAGNCKCTSINLYRDDDSDEAAETWRVRGESYAFIADQIERGHSPLSTITASSTTEGDAALQSTATDTGETVRTMSPDTVESE